MAIKSKTLLVDRVVTKKTAKQENEIVTVSSKTSDMLSDISLIVFGTRQWAKQVILITILVVMAGEYVSNKLTTLHFSILERILMYVFIEVILLTFVWILSKIKKEKHFDKDFMSYIDVFYSQCSAGRAIPICMDLSSNAVIDTIIGKDMKAVSSLIYKGNTVQEATNITGILNKFPYLNMKLFFTMLTISIDKGGDLSSNIGWLRGQMIKRKKINDKVKTMTAEAKMSRNILIALPVCFLGITYFFNKPNFNWLIDTSNGHIVLYGCSFFIAIGVMISSLIVSRAVK